jgi:amidase
MRGIALSHRGWLQQNEIRQRTRLAWASFFEDYDVLLCPCAHVPAFAHDHSADMQARRLEVNGELRPYTDILRWAGLTLNALLPATAVPLGTTRDGLPVGMQIASRHLGDRNCLAVARLLEAEHRAFVPPPGYAH